MGHNSYNQYKIHKLPEIDINLDVKKLKLTFGKIEEAIYMIKFLQE